MSTACVPSPAPVTSASWASIRRQLVGYRPDCESSLTACAPAMKSSKRTGAEARWTGRGRTRTHASVMIPSVPSDPMSIRSGEVPAPEPGSRRDSHTPAGVTARTDSTRSSMWVYTVAKWPPARVAIQPPSVENSNDWGKWRRVRPVLAEPSLQPRTGRAGLDARRQRNRVDLQHTIKGLQVDRHHAREVLAPGARLDTADHARAAPERDHRRAGRDGPLERRAHLGLVPRDGPRRPGDGRTGPGRRAPRRCMTGRTRASARW